MFKQIKKFLKITGISILILSVLLFAAMLLLQFVFYKQVSVRLKQLIEDNDEVQLHIGRLDFNLFTLNICATELTVNDTSSFLSLTCDTVLIKGLNPLPLIFQHHLRVSGIILSGGMLDINVDKNKPVSKKNQSSWRAKNILVKNWDIQINDSTYSAFFKLDTLNADNVNSGSQQILSLNTAKANISDILLIRKGSTYSLESIQVKLKDGFSSFQVNNLDFLGILHFFSNHNDSVNYPFHELLIEKIQLGVPVYYFKHISLKKLPQIEIPYLQIDGPIIHFHLSGRSDEINSPFTLKSIPLDIIFHQLIIENGQITLSQDSLPQIQFHLKQLNAQNFRTDSTYITYPVFADAINLSLTDLNYGFKDQIHQIKVNKLNYSTGTNRFQVDGFKIGSALDAEEYFKQRKFQTDMPSLDIHTVMFDGLNVLALLNDNKFIFRKIWADTLELKMTRDKNYPYDLKNFPPMIQDQILNLPYKFSVDTISVQHGEITYYEIPKGSTLEDAGMFQFTSVSLNMYQCTNDTSKLLVNDTLMVHFRGKLYNQGLMDVFVDIPLLSKNYWHRVYGTIGKFNARDFNRITIPAAAVKINKGNIKGGEFYFEANNEFSTGNIELLFEKLKVTVLTQTGNAAKSQADFLKSLIANVFLVHDNPEPGKKVMVGKIYFKRDVNRWMINYWWKSLLQGVRSIVFAKEVQLQEMASSFNEYKKLRKQREQIDLLKGE